MKFAFSAKVNKNMCSGVPLVNLTSMESGNMYDEFIKLESFFAGVSLNEKNHRKFVYTDVF